MSKTKLASNTAHCLINKNHITFLSETQQLDITTTNRAWLHPHYNYTLVTPLKETCKWSCNIFWWDTIKNSFHARKNCWKTTNITQKIDREECELRLIFFVKQERIEDLQKYVEALKYENSQLSGDSSRSQSSSIRRVRKAFDPPILFYTIIVFIFYFCTLNREKIFFVWSSHT